MVHRLSNLSYKVRDFKSEPDDALGQFLVILDDLPDDLHSFDVRAIELSSQSEGVYPILNCSCGIFSCGGFFVGVKHEGSKIIWEKFYITPPELANKERPVRAFEDLWIKDDKRIKAPLHFDRNKYENLVKALLNEKDRNVHEKEIYNLGLKVTD